MYNFDGRMDPSKSFIASMIEKRFSVNDFRVFFMLLKVIVDVDVQTKWFGQIVNSSVLGAIRRFRSTKNNLNFYHTDTFRRVYITVLTDKLEDIPI